MVNNNKRIIGIVIAAAFLLLIPLIAMQFTNEVKWNLFDFVIAGILLLGSGLVCEVVLRKVTEIKYRIAICIFILAGLMVVWVELAVGILGTPFAGS